MQQSTVQFTPWSEGPTQKMEMLIPRRTKNPKNKTQLSEHSTILPCMRSKKTLTLKLQPKPNSVHSTYQSQSKLSLRLLTEHLALRNLPKLNNKLPNDVFLGYKTLYSKQGSISQKKENKQTPVRELKQLLVSTIRYMTVSSLRKQEDGRKSGVLKSFEKTRTSKRLSSLSDQIHKSSSKMRTTLSRPSNMKKYIGQKARELRQSGHPIDRLFAPFGTQ